MPITDDKQTAKIFMIFDLPDKDTAFGALALATISGPAGEIFTMKEVRKQINDALAATNAAEDAIIATDDPNIIGEFDKIFLKEAKIFQDETTIGTLFDGEERIELMRRRLGSILGVYVPRGGFRKAFDAIARGKVGPTR